MPEITYYYNSNTGQNNHQVRLGEQKGNDRMLRKRKGYRELENLFDKVDGGEEEKVKGSWEEKEETMKAPVPVVEKDRQGH